MYSPSEKERRLVTVNIQSLKKNCERDIDLNVSPCTIHDITACTTFSWGSVNGAIYLCVATADNVVLMKYNYGTATFTIKKVCKIENGKAVLVLCNDG